MFLHRLGQLHPAARRHVGGVDVAHLQTVHLTQVPDCRDVAQEVRPIHAGGQAVSGVGRGNGAAGAQ